MSLKRLNDRLLAIFHINIIFDCTLYYPLPGIRLEDILFFHDPIDEDQQKEKKKGSQDTF